MCALKHLCSVSILWWIDIFIDLHLLINCPLLAFLTNPGTLNFLLVFIDFGVVYVSLQKKKAIRCLPNCEKVDNLKDRMIFYKSKSVILTKYISTVITLAKVFKYGPPPFTLLVVDLFPCQFTYIFISIFNQHRDYSKFFISMTHPNGKNNTDVNRIQVLTYIGVS